MEIQDTNQDEMWATVELMGHGQTAGRISMPMEWGGMLRVDVPDDNGGYTTEFYGLRAIYRVKFVSEQIARAYAPKERDIVSYDTPIVTREQHEAKVSRLRDESYDLRRQVQELERRLTTVAAFPAGDGTLENNAGVDENGVPF